MVFESVIDESKMCLIILSIFVAGYENLQLSVRIKRKCNKLSLNKSSFQGKNTVLAVKPFVDILTYF